MSSGAALLSVVIGVALGLMAVFNQRFFAARGYGGATDKEIPLWAGRLVFGFGGALFIIIGLYRLFAE